MAGKKRGLGKGLEALIPDEPVPNPESAKKNEDGETAGQELMVRISRVVPNADQPRKVFEENALEELTESIKEHGVIQPLIVKKRGDSFEIIAGERRWRAAQNAGLSEVPVIVRDYGEEDAAVISILENLQREDLNPIEEANAYAGLMETYHFTQEEVAKKVSKSRSNITNMLRLLKLNEEVRGMVAGGRISMGHARALLSLADEAGQCEIAKKAEAEKLSVREVEKLVKNYGKTRKPPKKKDAFDDDIFYQEAAKQLEEILGTRVSISRKDKSKGRLEIEYYSPAELERLMDIIRAAR